MKQDEKLQAMLDELFTTPETAVAAASDTKTDAPEEPRVETPRRRKATPAPDELTVPAPAPEDAKPARRRKTQLRKEEELDVTCREAPQGCTELLGVSGWLVLTYDSQDRAVGMLFDPAPDDVENAEAAIRGLLRGDGRIVLTETEDEGGGRWQFELIEDASLALTGEDELCVDYDAADCELEGDHPFNHGGF